ncbi:hypothetical protein [Streptomyces tagetis]|uniref:Uncharacterized protein n=1 Tax=Streptomyces tagetis TaxID=2820809 RepID=A0A940XC88_9ACTN|nr:hypothetical protein [Streptomyces sp. RG38]MBQ0827658.1 hypothetical protein [Streptomyces sp. RG38]
MTTFMAVPGTVPGRARDWIPVTTLAVPTVWMATSDGLVCIDLIAVERAINGTRRGWTLNADEARYAASLGFAAGLTYSLIGTRIGVSAQTMQSWFPELAAPKTERQARPRPRSRPEPVPRQPVRCGTRVAYQRHIRRGEPTCAPCRAAKSAADRYYRRHGTYVIPEGAS